MTRHATRSRDNPPMVTVIVATTCERRRRQSLLDAIDSLLSQDGARVLPVVVANGGNCDAGLMAELRARPGLRVAYVEEGSVTRARHIGRGLVESEFFCFLDDDDVYLPGALKARLAPLLADPSVDVVVSNGYRATDAGDELVFPDMAAFRRDPLGSLPSANWLGSCAGLYRSETVPEDFFEPEVPYYEWTYTALLLALEKRIAFVEEPTFRVTKSRVSLSQSEEYLLHGPKTLMKMLAFELPPRVRRRFRRRLASLLHGISSRYLESGDIPRAWAYHLRSLAQPSGLIRYILFTRKLIWAWPKLLFGK